MFGLNMEKLNSIVTEKTPAFMKKGGPGGVSLLVQVKTECWREWSAQSPTLTRNSTLLSPQVSFPVHRGSHQELKFSPRAFFMGYFEKVFFR